MVAQDLNRPKDGTAHATRETHHAIGAIPNCRDAVQRALNTGAIISAKVADARDHPREILFCHFTLQQRHIAGGESRLRAATEIHDDFKESVTTRRKLFARRELANAGNDLPRKAVEEKVEVVDDRLFLHDRGCQHGTGAVVWGVGKAHWKNPSAAAS